MNKTQQEAFLAQFWQDHIVSKGTTGLLLECSISVADLQEYYSLIGKQYNITRMKTIPDRGTIWLIKDAQGLPISCLYMTYCYDGLKGTGEGTKHILQWSYSYTRDLPQYRRRGLNITLRLASMLWANENGWDYMNSVPFELAHSNSILEKLDFQRHYDSHFDSYYYIKAINNKSTLLEIISKQLEKYLV